MEDPRPTEGSSLQHAITKSSAGSLQWNITLPVCNWEISNTHFRHLPKPRQVYLIFPFSQQTLVAELLRTIAELFRLIAELFVLSPKLPVLLAELFALIAKLFAPFAQLFVPILTQPLASAQLFATSAEIKSCWSKQQKAPIRFHIEALM